MRRRAAKESLEKLRQFCFNARSGGRVACRWTAGPASRRRGPRKMDVQPPASLTIRLAPTDNVVVSRADLLEGTAIPAEGVAARTRIPTGHKVAPRAIAEGAPVVKYDQVIGFATQAIAAGDHVHVHNCGMAEFDRDYAFCEGARPTAMVPEAERATFQGYRRPDGRSEEHTSELQSLMRISYAVFCLKKKKQN